MHAMQFSELKFLSKLLKKIRHCEKLDGLKDRNVMK